MKSNRIFLSTFSLLLLYLNYNEALNCWTCDGKCDCRAPIAEPCAPHTFCYSIRTSDGKHEIKKGCSADCSDVDYSKNHNCQMCNEEFCNQNREELVQMSAQSIDDDDDCTETGSLRSRTHRRRTASISNSPAVGSGVASNSEASPAIGSGISPSNIEIGSGIAKNSDGPPVGQGTANTIGGGTSMNNQEAENYASAPKIGEAVATSNTDIGTTFGGAKFRTYIPESDSRAYFQQNSPQHLQPNPQPAMTPQWGQTTMNQGGEPQPQNPVGPGIGRGGGVQPRGGSSYYPPVGEGVTAGSEAIGFGVVVPLITLIMGNLIKTMFNY